jgi:hypothetical protein
LETLDLFLEVIELLMAIHDFHVNVEERLILFAPGEVTMESLHPRWSDEGTKELHLPTLTHDQTLELLLQTVPVEETVELQMLCPKTVPAEEQQAGLMLLYLKTLFYEETPGEEPKRMSTSSLIFLAGMLLKTWSDEETTATLAPWRRVHPWFLSTLPILHGILNAALVKMYWKNGDDIDPENSECCQLCDYPVE